MSDSRFDYRQMTELEPDTLIERHKLNYWYEYIITGMAGLSNLAWIYFGKDLIPKGVEGTIQLFSPDYEMAPEMVEPLGWTLASISCAFYMLALKPAERARLSTLEYAKPLKEKMAALCQNMKKHPGRFAVDALNFTALNTATYAGSHSLFIPAARLSQEWFDLEEGSPQWWALFAGMHYLGFKYYKDFVRDLFYQGVDFIFDPKPTRSWLFSNFCRDTARITQLLLSVGCAIALKTIQNMGVVDTGNNEFDFKGKVGFEMPPAFVGVMSAWAYVFIMYPLLHEHYYGARNQGISLIKGNGFSSVCQQQPLFDEKVIVNKKTMTWKGVIKASPGVLLPMITFSGTIGFQTYKALSSIPGDSPSKLVVDYAIPSLLSITAAAGFLRGERNRVIEGKVLREMLEEAEDVQNDSCGIVAAATSLTVVNTIVDSSMAASFVPGMVGKSPGAVAAGLGAILYAAVTGVCFGANKMIASFRNLCGSRPSRNGMYSRTKPTGQVAQDEVQLNSIVSSPPSPTSLLK